MSGIRDKELINFIENNGGTLQNDVNLKTNYLLVKDSSISSTKVKKAHIIGSTIVSIEEFKTLL